MQVCKAASVILYSAVHNYYLIKTLSCDRKCKLLLFLSCILCHSHFSLIEVCFSVMKLECFVIALWILKNIAY